MTGKLYGMTDDESILSHAALDALVDGQSIFSTSGGWKYLPSITRHLDALVALLRTDEPLPAAVRLALADALDTSVDSPIVLVERRKKKKRITTVLKRVEKTEQVFIDYRNLQAGPRKMSGTDALFEAAERAGVNDADAQRMLADGFAKRSLSEEVGKAIERGDSVGDIRVMMLNFEKEGRPRGRKPKTR